MTDDKTAAPGGTTTSEAGLLPFDISVAHQAWMYDFLLGGKIELVHTKAGRPGPGVA